MTFAAVLSYNEYMPNELTIIYERDEDGWWVATIPEVPGAFSQGRTRPAARANVIDALTQLMAARRELALRDRPQDSELELLPLTG